MPFNVILCPASHLDAVRNYELSVEKPVKIAEEERARLRAPHHGDIRVWGAKSKVQWDKAKTGDLLVFVRSGAAFACARCLGTQDNAAMAAHAWQAMEWPYLFYVEAPLAISIPVVQMNAALGYSPKYKIRQLLVLTDSQSSALMELMQSSLPVHTSR